MTDRKGNWIWKHAPVVRYFGIFFFFLVSIFFGWCQGRKRKKWRQWAVVALGTTKKRRGDWEAQRETKSSLSMFLFLCWWDLWQVYYYYFDLYQEALWLMPCNTLSLYSFNPFFWLPTYIYKYIDVLRIHIPLVYCTRRVTWFGNDPFFYLKDFQVSLF